MREAESQRRAELLKLIEAPGRPLLDDEAFDLDNSWIPFAVCIQRPDGIAIHAEQHQTLNELRVELRVTEDAQKILVDAFWPGNGVVQAARGADQHPSTMFVELRPPKLGVVTGHSPPAKTLLGSKFISSEDSEPNPTGPIAEGPSIRRAGEDRSTCGGKGDPRLRRLFRLPDLFWISEGLDQGKIRFQTMDDKILIPRRA